MDQTVPAVERPTKRAALLKREDWIAANELPGQETPGKVLWTRDYQLNGDKCVLVAFEAPDGVPNTVRFRETERVDLATFEELAGIVDDQQRHTIADHLRELAALLDSTALPMPGQMKPRVEFFMRNVGEVAYVARAIGVEIEVDSAGRHSARLRPGGPTAAGIAEWFCYVEKEEPEARCEDADETGHGHSREVVPEDAPPTNGRRSEPHFDAITEDGAVPAHAPAAVPLSEQR